MDKSVVESYPRYDRYKNSKVDWLGDIPEEWELQPAFKFIEENKVKNNNLEEKTVLSLSYGKIVIKPAEKLTGLVPESFESYQIVQPNDIIIRCTDLQNDKNSLRIGLVNNKGIITSAYLGLKIKDTYSPDYLYYYLHSLDTSKAIYKMGTGLRQNLSFKDFKRFSVPNIELKTQNEIVEFLKEKTAQIDQAITLKQQQIAKLEEYKQIVIQNAVTKGLNPDVPMKDSGIDWIGKIPEHWEVKKLKFITTINRLTLSENTNKDFKFNYVDIGSVTFEAGIINSETLLFRNAPSRARRIAKVGDTIVSTVRTYLKAIDYIDTNKSNYIYSTGFAILSPYKLIQPRYLTYFVWSDAFTRQVRDFSKGVSYPAINSSELGNLFVVISSTNEQIQVIEYINKHSNSIRNAINNLNDGINRLKEYKTILINQAVTGKIKVS